jgi:hypothetical protein
MIHIEQGCGVRTRRASGRRIHGVFALLVESRARKLPAIAPEFSPANFVAIGGDAAANQDRAQYDKG